MQKYPNNNYHNPYLEQRKKECIESVKKMQERPMTKAQFLAQCDMLMLGYGRPSVFWDYKPKYINPTKNVNWNNFKWEIMIIMITLIIAIADSLMSNN